MKKIMIALAVIATAVMVRAATVDWGLTATANEKDHTVYLFASEVSANYDTFADLTAGAFASAGVVEKTNRGKVTYSIADNAVGSDNLGDTLYFVLVSGADAKDYVYGSADISSLTYNPAAQQTSPGSLSLSPASFGNAGTIGAVPEPTSGMLLLLGMAGLALRRKQK